MDAMVDGATAPASAHITSATLRCGEGARHYVGREAASGDWHVEDVELAQKGMTRELLLHHATNEFRESRRSPSGSPRSHFPSRHTPKKDPWRGNSRERDELSMGGAESTRAPTSRPGSAPRAPTTARSSTACSFWPTERNATAMASAATIASTADEDTLNRWRMHSHWRELRKRHLQRDRRGWVSTLYSKARAETEHRGSSPRGRGGFPHLHELAKQVHLERESAKRVRECNRHLFRPEERDFAEHYMQDLEDEASSPDPIEKMCSLWSEKNGTPAVSALCGIRQRQLMEVERLTYQLAPTTGPPMVSRRALVNGLVMPLHKAKPTGPGGAVPRLLLNPLEAYGVKAIVPQTRAKKKGRAKKKAGASKK